MKKSFTMIELIFVIVILGILAAVAIPKLAATRSDAEIAKMSMNVETAVADISSYALAKATTETNLSKMSNAIKSLEDAGIADNSEENKSVLKVDEDDDCITLEVITSNGEKNISVTTKDNPKSLKCKVLKKILNKQKYSVKIEGSNIKL